MISIPRESLNILLGRLRILWRFPAGVIFIRPDAVTRNLFFALLFVFNLGIFTLYLRFRQAYNAAPANRATLIQQPGMPESSFSPPLCIDLRPLYKNLHLLSKNTRICQRNPFTLNTKQ
jgi:hypothetical protein